ncbi:NAD(P)/FAD-dependent oxidoreductase [Streptomyces thermolineatus]
MTSTTSRTVVVGGGMAGVRLVDRLAALGAADGVTVIGEEPHAPYNRLLLDGVLAGRYAPEVVELPRPDGPAYLSGVRAVRIDRDDAAVVCDNGDRVPYDTLVLATGSSAVLPPLRGLSGTAGTGSPRLPEGVRTFRTMDDCLALAPRARPGVRAVVVGGGLLGVCAARALASRGVRVVLAQRGGHLMDRHLDPRAAALLRAHLESLGVEVRTGCRVRGLLVRGSGEGRAVEGVETADGSRTEADLVVPACGVRPRTGLAAAAGLTVRRGIVVDDGLRTDDPRIHAIGDCAEHRGTVHGLAGPARDQADLLARRLAAPGGAGGTGRVPLYRGSRVLTRLTLTGPRTGTGPATSPSAAGDGTTTTAGEGTGDVFDLAAFGEVAAGPEDHELLLSDATRGAYRKVVLRDGRLVGGILLGDLAAVGTLARTWEGGEPLPGHPIHLLTTDGGHR